MKKTVLVFSFFAFCMLSSFSRLNITTLGGKITTVVIDAGHGGKDPGAITAGVKEKDVTLSIAKKLGALIKEKYPEVKVFYTRSTDNFIELSERSSIANRNKADLFISIHCNHSESTSANGTETYVMGTHKNEGNLEVAKRENSAILLEDNYTEGYDGFDPDSPEGHIIFSFHQNAYMEQSIVLASKIERYLSRRKITNKSRGVKQAGFLVLWRTTMPGVLIETGFLTNTNERKYLASDTGKQEIANSLFNAFKEYKEEAEK